MTHHHPLITAAEMKAWEAEIFARGVDEASLMEQAGCGLAAVISARHPQPGRLLVYAGTGHNAADALVAARWLAAEGWRIAVRFFGDRTRWKPMLQQQWERLQDSACLSGEFLDGPTVILDALLGIGSSGKLRPEIEDAVLEIQNQRKTSSAEVIAVDLPTGLDPDSGNAAVAVAADATVTFGLPKLGLVTDAAIPLVGRLYVVPFRDVPPPSVPLASRDSITSGTELAQMIRRSLPRRPFSFHKGEAGRVGLVAGSPGMLGAAHLASLGAMAAGAGLITVYVPEQILLTAMAALPPEIMVRGWRDTGELRADAWGVGPGIGRTRSDALWKWMRESPEPMVWDADALHWLAQDGACAQDFVAGHRLLTPHPGEFRRLWPEESPSPRAVSARAFTKNWPVTLLAKSSRSIIAQAGRPLIYNTTGTPAMASGGMGDVLTGYLTALLAQGMPAYDAAIYGSWQLGLAGEMAAKGRRAVRASEVAAALPYLSD